MEDWINYKKYKQDGWFLISTLKSKAKNMTNKVIQINVNSMSVTVLTIPQLLPTSDIRTLSDPLGKKTTSVSCNSPYKG